MKRVLNLAEAAAAYGQSEKTLRRAIAATDPSEFPPPLNAKRQGHGVKAKYQIHVDELDRWFSLLPDA